MSKLTKAKRRIKQLERALQFTHRWISHRLIDLNANGADRPDNESYRELRQLQTRLNRTCPRS